MKKMLPSLNSPEIVIGFCSPIGTNNASIVDVIKEELRRLGYKVHAFKVTTLMKSAIIPEMSLVEQPLEARYRSYIDYANKLRSLFQHAGTLGMMCCAAIRAFRRKETGTADSYIQNNCYIFDQFKRVEEIEVLRQTYGRLFVLVSIYSSPETRKNRLSDGIASHHSSSRPTLDHENDASQLMRRDENEDEDENGQRIRDVFPMADLFVNADDMASAKLHVQRFFDAFFGSNKISPTGDEYGMYMAKTAALRSLDLSRQVGAAIFTKDNEVISLGSNEVPKAGGGTYWCDDIPDQRDYALGRDANERIKRTLLADIAKRIHETFKDQITVDEEQFVRRVQAESEVQNSPICNSELMDLLEFGRATHAEMSAITDAARLGVPIKGAKLYCTTFPCHICAKHIVCSGISSVKYIEPYPKSYADQLHKDSILVGIGPEVSESKVRFEPFIGISPFRFRDLFERKKRKDSAGKFAEWADGEPRPIVRYTVATYLTNEEAFVKMLETQWGKLEAGGKIRKSDDIDASV
jgi:deoxycytidylate deaminase